MNVIDRIKKYPKHVEKMRDAYGYNEGVRGAWTPIWCRNAGRNYATIEKIFDNRNADMSMMQALVKPGPAIILASGPSQHDIRPYLNDWKGGLFISTSQLPLCAKMGIEPTVCILIDADPKMAFLVTEYAKDFKNTIFITHPQVPREIIEAWDTDRIFFFRMLDPGDKFSNDYLPLIYGWMNEQKNWAIKSTILNGGNVTNTLIPMAQALNQKPIFMAGYDLGYPDNLMRCSDVKRLPDGTWEEIPGRPLTKERWKEAIKIESNNGVPLDELGVFYKTSTMIMWGMSNPPIISCSRGIMSEWPYVHPREVIEKRGQGFDHLLIDPITAYRASQAYLRPRGFLNLKTDFFVYVKNAGALKGWDRIKTLVSHWWLNGRPWKWLGGRGYVPLKIRLGRWKESRKKRRVKNV